MERSNMNNIKVNKSNNISIITPYIVSKPAQHHAICSIPPTIESINFVDVISEIDKEHQFKYFNLRPR